MNEPVLPFGEMSVEAKLEDVLIRERQLEVHLLHSPDYLWRANRELKRQVALLYLAIALLILFQGLFTWRNLGRLPVGLVLLNTGTSLLAIINTLLIIRTKRSLRQLNEAWLKPAERSAIDSLRDQRAKLLEEV